ncbi:MAG: hypothetical protein ABSB29_08375 [Nitrososphaerales archaeon]|jgi:hypothetical protein
MADTILSILRKHGPSKEKRAELSKEVKEKPPKPSPAHHWAAATPPGPRGRPDRHRPITTVDELRKMGEVRWTNGQNDGQNWEGGG